ncbi:MAG: hypothetical protein R3C53_11655 [Pirellulaceae bacterium]
MYQSEVATSGMYFSLPGRAKIIGNGCGFIATRIGWTGFFHLGGPAETQGRLKYIDGCGDSLLISPVVVGDLWRDLLYCTAHPTNAAHAPKLPCRYDYQRSWRVPHGSRFYRFTARSSFQYSP